jgi:hypothetical protein
MGLLDDSLSGQTLTFLFVESHKILKDGKKKIALSQVIRLSTFHYRLVYIDFYGI